MYSKISNNPFKQQAILNSNSMTSACELIGNTSYNTFKKWAKIYDLWKPNQSGIGISKNRKFIPLFDDVDFQSISNIRNLFGNKDEI